MLISGGGGSGSETPLQSAIDPDWVMFIIYKEQPADDVPSTSTPSGEGAYSGNAWSKNALIAIREMETPIKESPDFNLYCWADPLAVVPESPRK